MKRRIIKQGHNTLTVTLPACWTKSLGLKGGDEVEILEKDNMLAMYAAKNPPSSQITIDLRGFTIQMMWKYFSAAYRQGYDEVKVIYDPECKTYENAYSYFTQYFPHSRLGEKLPGKPALNTIQDIVNRFIGWGIIDAGENSCIIRELSEDSRKEFENSQRRIFLLILQMFEHVIRTLESNRLSDIASYQEIHILDTNVDRFHDFCCRVINKMGHPIPSRKSLALSSIWLLELLGDELKHIAIHCARAKKNISAAADFARQVMNQFTQFYKLFYSFDRALVTKISENDYRIYADNFKCARKEGLNYEERGIFSHLKQIAKLIVALTELRIEMEMCR